MPKKYVHEFKVVVTSRSRSAHTAFRQVFDALDFASDNYGRHWQAAVSAVDQRGNTYVPEEARGGKRK
jgi:hypothetical protein